MTVKLTSQKRQAQIEVVFSASTRPSKPSRSSQETESNSRSLNTMEMSLLTRLLTLPSRFDTDLYPENFLELLRRSWILHSLWSAMWVLPSHDIINNTIIGTVEYPAIWGVIREDISIKGHLIEKYKTNKNKTNKQKGREKRGREKRLYRSDVQAFLSIEGILRNYMWTGKLHHENNTCVKLWTW